MRGLALTLVAVAVGTSPAAAVPVLVSQQNPADALYNACLGGVPGNPPVHAETSAHAAASGATVVAAWATTGTTGTTIVSTASSPDGGATWTPPVTLPLNACAGGPAGFPSASEPWAAFARDGRAYVAATAADRVGDRLLPTRSRITVSASVDGGRSFGPARAVATARPGFAYESAVIAADPTAAGRAYVVATRYSLRGSSRSRAAAAGPVVFSRSINGGRTWGRPRPITPRVFGERRIEPQLIVDPRSGKLYCIYYRVRPDRADIVFIASANRGLRWTPERLIARVQRLDEPPATAGPGRIPVNAGEQIARAAIDPASGRLYVTFLDARASGGLYVQPVITSSISGGRRWTTPARINTPTGGSAWLPVIAATPAAAAVAYLDARAAPALPGLTLPVNLWLATFAISAGSIVGRTEVEVDRFNYLGTATRRGYTVGTRGAILTDAAGFHPLYVRSNCPIDSIACAPNLTDVYVGR